MVKIGTTHLTENFLHVVVLQDMEENARPTQKLNNRDISLFRPIPQKHY